MLPKFDKKKQICHGLALPAATVTFFFCHFRFITTERERERGRENGTSDP